MSGYRSTLALSLYSQVVGHTQTRFWVQPWLGRDLFWCQSVPQQYPFAGKAPIRSSSKEGGNRNSSLNKQKTNTLGLNEHNLLPCVAEKPTATLESSLDPQFQIMSEEPSSARLLAYSLLRGLSFNTNSLRPGGCQLSLTGSLSRGSVQKRRVVLKAKAGMNSDWFPWFRWAPLGHSLSRF